MTPADRYGAVVIGSGPGGRGVAKRLVSTGMQVAMVESELVGGECPFWACIPSKALLRPVEVVSEARHAAGLAAPAVSWPEVSEYRDYMNSGLDDSKKFEAFSKMGIEIIRGEGHIVGTGRVAVGEQVLETERIVVATGTSAAIPDLEGMGDIEYWTNREATSFHDVPQSTIVLGGGPVGVELGQLLRLTGARSRSSRRLIACSPESSRTSAECSPSCSKGRESISARAFRPSRWRRPPARPGSL